MTKKLTQRCLGRMRLARRERVGPSAADQGTELAAQDLQLVAQDDDFEIVRVLIAMGEEPKKGAKKQVQDR